MPDRRRRPSLQAGGRGGSTTKKVAITGADGLIGTVLRRHLTGRYVLRPLTRKPIDEPSEVVDVTDLAGLLAAFTGVDSVVHLAAAASPDSSWEDVLGSNIMGTRNVYEAARRQGVAQVVFASSSHAVAMHEHDAAPEIYESGDPRLFDEHVELRPDSLYGLSKAFGEICGRLYSDRHGLRVICLRIGHVARDDGRASSSPDTRSARMRALWLSERDCAELFACALDADHIRWAVAYGTSDNQRQVWDLTSARELLGYGPRDGAAEPAATRGGVRQPRRS